MVCILKWKKSIMCKSKLWTHEVIMKSRTVVKPFFLTKSDERVFSQFLLKEYPSIKFVDDSRWPTSEPVICNSIDDCKSDYVFLWPSDIIEKLPTIPHGNEFDGPQSGVVMQFMRCREKNNGLLSGQIGVGFSEKNAWMGEWSKMVLKILSRMNASKLKTIGDNSFKTSDYVVGEGAITFLKNGGYLKYNSGTISYELA